MSRPLRWALFGTAGIVALIVVLIGFAASPPGTRLIAGRVLGMVNGQLTGTVQVDHVRGSILRHLVFEGVSVTDRDGQPVLAAQRLEVSYNPLGFLGGRFVLGPVVVDSPSVWIRRRTPDGPFNVNTLTPPAEEPAGPSTSLIALEDLIIRGGAAEVHLPAEPPVGSSIPRTGQTYIVQAVDLEIPRLQLASPGTRRDVRITVERLAARIVAPHDVPVGLEGNVSVDNDSLSVDLTAISVGQASASLVGWARLGIEPIEFSGRLDARSVDADVLRRFVSSLPEELTGLSGDARILVRSVPGGGYHLVGDTVSIQSARGETLSGRLEGTWVDRSRWDVDTASVMWTGVDVDRFRAFLDTLPIGGTINGQVALVGSPDGVQLAITASLRDERGRMPASVDASGALAWRQDTITLSGLSVRRFQVDLRSARTFAPALQMPGVVSGNLMLDGTLQDLRVRGAVRHSGSDIPTSSLRGTARVMARSTGVALRTDITIDSVFPGVLLERWGVHPVRGRLMATGGVDSMDVDADLRTHGGRLDATGTVVTRGEGLASLDGSLFTVDASMFHAGAPPTDLTGTMSASVRSWRGPQPVGEAVLRFDSAVVAGTRFSDVHAALVATDSTFRVDSLWLRGPAFTARGAGRIGRDDRTRGTVTMNVEADSLHYFARLIDWLAGSDSIEATPVTGRAVATVQVEGSLDRFDAGGSVTVQELMRGSLASHALSAEVAWTSGDSTVMLAGSADSLSIADVVFDTTDVRVDGALRSMRWAVLLQRDTISVAAGGRASVGDTLVDVTADTLAVTLPASQWRTITPWRVAVRGRQIQADSVVIARSGRTGRIVLAGHYAPDDSVRLLAVVDSFPMADLAGFLPNPPAGVGGFLLANIRARGSPDAPALDGEFQIVDATVENVAIPRMSGSASYANQKLTGELSLVRNGQPILQANGDLPVDLSFPGPADRRLEGPITISGQLDSMRLETLDAFVTAVEEASGSLRGSVSVTGTWLDPEMRGSVVLRDGAATLPALGINLTDLQSELDLVRDTIRVGRLRAASGPGTVDVSGVVWLEELSRPILQLVVRADRFQAMNDPEFLALVASGDLQVQGPVFGATVTGAVETPNAALYFDRLIDNQMIDLSDPLYASFVDTTVLAEADLRPEFQAAFVDSLTIRDLDITMGSDVWLRSEDVNVQLTGSLRVNKLGEQYSATGVLSALRGTYVLRLGPAISREFRVVRGEVRYLGTADLNATLDIDAEHTVRTFRGDNVRVQAHIGGTIEAPEVTLSSDLGTNVSDTEVISYLLFGAPSVQAFAGSGGRDDRSVFQQGAERLTDVLAGQLEAGLTSGLGIPLDYLKITPGSLESGLSGTEILVGKQLNLFGRSSFLTASPRLCPQDQLVSLDKIGASIETWLTNHWLIAASVDPLKGCETPAPGTTSYQLGADVFWEIR